MNASFRKPRDQDRSIRRTIESARSIIEPGNECAWQIERSLSQAITLEAESDKERSICHAHSFPGSMMLRALSIVRRILLSWSRGLRKLAFMHFYVNLLTGCSARQRLSITFFCAHKWVSLRSNSQKRGRTVTGSSLFKIFSSTG